MRKLLWKLTFYQRNTFFTKFSVLTKTRRILIQAQAELKNEQKGNLNKNKAKIANVRENFSKNVKKYFWEAYLKDNEG